MPSVSTPTVQVLDPIDTVVVDIALTASEAYIVLEALYGHAQDDPHKVLDVAKYIEDRLLDHELPLTRQDFDSEYLNDHTDNEQYQRIVLH